MALTTVVVVKYYTVGQLRLQNSLKGPILNFPVLPRLTARARTRKFKQKLNPMTKGDIPT
jgi:hypothetical protein